jgi:hypothetical protein
MQGLLPEAANAPAAPAASKGKPDAKADPQPTGSIRGKTPKRVSAG